VGLRSFDDFQLPNRNSWRKTIRIVKRPNTNAISEKELVDESILDDLKEYQSEECRNTSIHHKSSLKTATNLRVATKTRRIREIPRIGQSRQDQTRQTLTRLCRSKVRLVSFFSQRSYDDSSDSEGSSTEEDLCFIQEQGKAMKKKGQALASRFLKRSCSNQD
jgi:hypothetical protein